MFKNLKEKFDPDLFSKKNIIIVLALGIVALSVPISIQLVQTQTQIKSQAQFLGDECQYNQACFTDNGSEGVQTCKGRLLLEENVLVCKYSSDIDPACSACQVESVSTPTPTSQPAITPPTPSIVPSVTPPAGSTSGSNGACRDDPGTGAPPGYKWVALCHMDCFSNDAVDNSGKCPKNTAEGGWVNPDNSKWCFPFNGGGKCLQVQSEERVLGRVYKDSILQSGYTVKATPDRTAIWRTNQGGAYFEIYSSYGRLQNNSDKKRITVTITPDAGYQCRWDLSHPEESTAPSSGNGCSASFDLIHGKDLFRNHLNFYLARDISSNPPLPPSNIKAECSADKRSATIRWDAPLSGQTLKYDVRTNGPGTKDSRNNCPEARDLKLCINRLEQNSVSMAVDPDKEYDFWAHSVDLSNRQSAAEHKKFTCSSTDNLTAPTNLQFACSADPRQVTLSWSKPANLQSAIRVNGPGDKYSGNNCSGTYPHRVCINNLVKNSLDLTITPGELYDFWVHTKDPQSEAYSLPSEHKSFSCEISAAKPSPPSSLDASCLGGNLTLNWPKVADASSYVVRGGKGLTTRPNDTDWDSFALDNKIVGDATTCTNNSCSFTTNVKATGQGIKNGDSYFVWVHSKGSSGVSEPRLLSQPVICTTGTSGTPTTTANPTQVQSGAKCLAEVNFYDRWSTLISVGLYDKDYDCNGNSLIEIVDYNIWRNRKFNLIPNP